MSTKARQRARRAVRDAQGYDHAPPRCASCLYFSAAHLEQVNQVAVRRNAHCSFGNFHTHANAVCDEWRNQRGERIAAENDHG